MVATTLLQRIRKTLEDKADIILLKTDESLMKEDFLSRRPTSHTQTGIIQTVNFSIMPSEEMADPRELDEWFNSIAIDYEGVERKYFPFGFALGDARKNPGLYRQNEISRLKFGATRYQERVGNYEFRREITTRYRTTFTDPELIKIFKFEGEHKEVVENESCELIQAERDNDWEVNPDIFRVIFITPYISADHFNMRYYGSAGDRQRFRDRNEPNNYWMRESTIDFVAQHFLSEQGSRKLREAALEVATEASNNGINTRIYWGGISDSFQNTTLIGSNIPKILEW